MYQCKRCNYSTNVRCNMTTHFLRRNPCEPLFSNINPYVLLEELNQQPLLRERQYTCMHCGMGFKHRQSRFIHIKTSCQKCVRPLHALAVNRKPYGSESWHYITEDLQFMTRCIFAKETGLVQLVERMHFDPHHLENNTIRITNIKLPYIRVYTKDCLWHIEPVYSIIDDIINNAKNLLEEHMQYNETYIMAHPRYGKMLLDQAKGFVTIIKKSLEEDDADVHPVLKKIRHDIHLLIINKNKSTH